MFSFENLDSQNSRLDRKTVVIRRKLLYYVIHFSVNSFQTNSNQFCKTRIWKMVKKCST